MSEFKIKCIAVDDEPLAIKQMVSFISKVNFLELIETFDNAADALNFLKTNKVDLIFLDIQMDEFTGIEMLEVLDKRPHVILTTAYSSYALQGYELDVTDYLLKPILYQRFVKAVNKVFDKMFGDIKKLPQLKNEEIQTTTIAKEDYLFVKTKYHLQKVVYQEILYIEGLSNYLIIKTKTENIYTLMSFSQICEKLPKENFFRIHKSFIVNIENINNISKNFVKIVDAEIPIGELYKKAFFDFLNKKNIL